MYEKEIKELMKIEKERRERIIYMELKINTTKLGGLKAVNFITDFLITNDITSFITTSKKETTFKIAIDVIPKEVINGLYEIIGDCSSVCKYELHK